MAAGNLAKQLFDIARGGGKVAASSFTAPASVAEAMVAQAELCALLGGKVHGWKIGMAPDGAVAGALMVIDDASAQGMRADFIEAEMAYRLANDIPVRDAPWTRDEIATRVASVHLGIELVSLRFEEGTKVPFLLLLAERITNESYIVGPELARSFIDCRDASTIPLTVTRNGASVHDGPARHGSTDPLAPLVAYANAQSDRMGGLKRGQIVTTGNLCGLVAVEGEDVFDIRFGGVGLSFRVSRR